MAQQTKKSAASGGKSGTARGRSAAAEARAAAAEKRREERRRQHRRAIAALIMLALGVFTLLGYFNNDGVFIKFLRTFLAGLFGGGFYLLPPMLILSAGLLALSREKNVIGRVVCALLVPVLIAAFCQIFSSEDYEPSFRMFSGLWSDGAALSGGGVIGGTVTVLFSYLFSKAGAAIVLVCLSVFVVITVFGLTIPAVIDMMKERRKRKAELEYEEYSEPEPEPEPRRRQAEPQVSERGRRKAIDIPMDGHEAAEQPKPKKDKKPSLFNKNPAVPAPDTLFGGDGVKAEPAEPEPPVNDTRPEEPPLTVEVIKREPPAEERTEPPKPVKPSDPPVTERRSADISKEAAELTGLIEESAKRDIHDAMQAYKYPPISLLKEPVRRNQRDSEDELQATKERLELCLRSFGVNVTISNIINGPSITRYEMELEIGVKLNKLTGLADDIALALGVSGVRIAAIPNKISTVGIEVPNKNVSTVYLRDIISSPEFKNAKSKLTFAIGKNISGEVMVGNISKLPHLLVAGTTGSGKSVCLNSLILSLLYKASPDEVKFIMVDPKMVEFKIYNGIPHLLIPVVTEAKKAAGALQWAVTEMMKRYRLFSDMGARDIASYNAAIAGTDTPKMPQIVVIIDELADLMMIAAKEVEESICRVAQMGRAAGVHLVIATQSPRADVITGLMKANIPSRIALKVASSLESRIILDAGGAADKLVGNGDMLFAPIGASKPTRIQGTWVSDEEREAVVEYVKQSGEASYSEDVIYEIERAAAEKESGSKPAPAQDDKKDCDELLPQAADVIFETQQASVSMLQRRLKLGYARAARIVDQLEEIGVLGPFEGSKPRQILITRQQWQEMQFVNGTAPTESAPRPAPQSGSGAEQTMFSADDLFENGGEN